MAHVASQRCVYWHHGKNMTLISIYNKHAMIHWVGGLRTILVYTLVMLIGHVFVDCAVHVLLGFFLHLLDICLICCCCSYVTCFVEGSDYIEGSEQGVYGASKVGWPLTGCCCCLCFLLGWLINVFVEFVCGLPMLLCAPGVGRSICAAVFRTSRAKHAHVKYNPR